MSQWGQGVCECLSISVGQLSLLWPRIRTSPQWGRKSGRLIWQRLKKILIPEVCLPMMTKSFQGLLKPVPQLHSHQV